MSSYRGYRGTFKSIEKAWVFGEIYAKITFDNKFGSFMLEYKGDYRTDDRMVFDAIISFDGELHKVSANVDGQIVIFETPKLGGNNIEGIYTSRHPGDEGKFSVTEDSEVVNKEFIPRDEKNCLIV